MFWSNNKTKVYPCIPQFYYIKVGFKGVYYSWTCFPDEKEMKFTHLLVVAVVDML